jgi:Transmembrane domain of unknown function (DUF3566)
MADHPARRGYDPADDETGWGSPMPAEYGSLTAFPPPLADASSPWDEPVEDRPRPRARGQGQPRRPRPAAGTPQDAPALPAADGARSRPSANNFDPTAAPAPLRRQSGRSSAAIPPGSVSREGAAVIGPAAGASQIGRERGATDGGRVEEPRRAQTSAGTRPARRPAQAQWAQSERTVRHLNVWTVAKVSVVFYLLLLAVVVVASVMLWYVANALGAIQSIEKSVRTLFDLSKFTLHPGAVALYTSLGGAVLALVGTLANILVAVTYNLISDVVGGIRFKIVEDTAA